MREYIEICKIINTHGIAGMVKAEPWCDSPAVLAKLKKIYRKEKDGTFSPLNIHRGAVQGEFVLLHFDGYTTFEHAAAIKNTVLFAHRDDIPVGKNGVLIDDLIGLDVIDADSGTVYGKMKDVMNLGASDIYVIDTQKGEVMMPAVKEYLDHIDTEKGVFIRPIPGFFDEN